MSAFFGSKNTKPPITKNGVKIVEIDYDYQSCINILRVTNDFEYSEDYITKENCLYAILEYELDDGNFVIKTIRDNNSFIIDEDDIKKFVFKPIDDIYIKYFFKTHVRLSSFNLENYNYQNHIFNYNKNYNYAKSPGDLIHLYFANILDNQIIENNLLY